MMRLDWRYNDGLFITDLVTVASECTVLDMLSLHTSPWASGLLEYAVTVTISNLAGSEVLILEAGPLFIAGDSVGAVGFAGVGEFTEVRRTGTDLVLHQSDEGPDKVFSTDGGVFIVKAEVAVEVS